MNFFDQLKKQQHNKKTHLCVGLDPHKDKIPKHLKGCEDPVLEFLKAIVDSTADYACCFKPQIAFFAAYGLEATLWKTMDYIHSAHPGMPIILDTKRNDIGTTAEMYAEESFVRYGADATTVNPYMGKDSIAPFTRHKDKGVFVLCRTSNEGAKELQNITVGDGEPLYHLVADKALTSWNPNGNVGLVIGATAVSELRKIRAKYPDVWFLVPGIGAQGGDLQAAIEYGRSPDGHGLIINSARSILYASCKKDFAEKAAEEAQKMQEVMAPFF